jgi:adenylate cyclase
LAYAEGLARFRARDFSGAAQIFAKSAEHDQASALFAARALELARCPPDADWDPVNTLYEK